MNAQSLRICNGVMLLISLLIYVASVNAQVVHKCVDANGRVTFSDKGCSAAKDVSSSRHEVRTNSTIKSDASHQIQDRTIPPNYSSELGGSNNASQGSSASQNSIRTSNRSVTQSSTEQEYEKKLQFQKEQLIKEERRRPAEYLRGWVIKAIDCLPRNRQGLMHAQEIVTEWYRGRSEKKIREFVGERGCAGAAPENPKRSTRPSPPSPSIITSCDTSGCWDNSGKRYNRAGHGNTYFRSSAEGGVCRQIGNRMDCH